MAIPCCSCTLASHATKIAFSSMPRFHVISHEGKQSIAHSLMAGHLNRASRNTYLYSTATKRTKMTCIPTEPSLTRRRDTSRVLPVFSTTAATFAASRLFTPLSSRSHDQNSRTASRSSIMILGVRRRTSQLATPHVIHRGTTPPDIPLVSCKDCSGTR
jgi:hypothetical protein